MSAIRVNGAWRTPSIVYAKVDGQWRIVGETFSRVNGVWRSTTFASPPDRPIMTYVSTGVFQISNYNSTLTYEAIFKTGSGGTATLNTSNGRYTLNTAWSGFDVVARYAPGSPASAAGYMERKPYSFSCRQVFGTCCDTCCELVGGNCGCVGAGPSGCPPGSSPNGQCGCGGPGRECMTGTIGEVVCSSCNCRSCVVANPCDVLINEPGYVNSGTEWYKVS